MTPPAFRERLAQVCGERLPPPGRGRTAVRHRRLFAVAAEDVSLAKLAEAHWDALAILDEAGRTPEPGAIYAVWASETPGKPLQLTDGTLSGQKAFCSGCGLVDRALITIGASDGRLLDVDVRPGAGVQVDMSHWQPDAFRLTQTGAVVFCRTPLGDNAVVGPPGFYLHRAGFWNGACGPAACWAGGAAGLLTYANESKRDDAHTLAHLAGMHANVWAMEAILETAGHEMDASPDDRQRAEQRALTVRHLIEQLASNTLVRFGRAYGPAPLAMHAETARRYHETEIFMRQSHGERDLEALATLIRQQHTSRAALEPSNH